LGLTLRVLTGNIADPLGRTESPGTGLANPDVEIATTAHAG